MCGIAGIVGDIRPGEADAAVRRMVGTLIRRGPYGEGIEVWNGAVLGHRRLAIFDLSDAGHQPMLSADRSIGVVFNGAIYNWRELRRELEKRGQRFRSNSDTEVLIAGYAEWGVEGLVSKLRGMFAAGIWDNVLHKLYLVRDRLGVKPLLFSIHKGVLYFASTLRALLAGGCGTGVDRRAVAAFLSLGFVPDQNCMYKGVVKVPAASIVEWTGQGVRQWAYWESPRADEGAVESFEGAVEKTEELLLAAVRRRLDADVPVSALLSAGIDSSLICWATRKLGSSITAYTLGTPGHSCDESVPASATARKLGIRHRLLDLSPSQNCDIDDLVSAYSEPFACASALGMLRLSRAMAGTSKVMLTGDGGDDVFLGYPRHRHLWLAEKLARLSPRSLKEWWVRSCPQVPDFQPARRAAALFDYAVRGPQALIEKFHTLSSYNGMLGARFGSAPQHSGARVHDGYGMVQSWLNYELATHFVGEYLTKVDGATMHYGIEARSPFLDQDLWEFSASLSVDLRLRRGRLKAILRELAHRRIGPEVAWGRKRGFGVPVHRWIATRWHDHVEQVMRDSVLGREGWISVEHVLNELKAAQCRGRAPDALWYLYVLELWMRREIQADKPGDGSRGTPLATDRSAYAVQETVTG